MPKGPSKPKAKPKAKAKPAPSPPSAKKRPGAAKKSGRAGDGTFGLGNMLSKMRPHVHPDATFQDAQRKITYDTNRLARAWAVVDLHMEMGSLDAAIFAIRMSCGREPMGQGLAAESTPPIMIGLPEGYEPPPWMARKKVENLAEKPAEKAGSEAAHGQRNQ